MADPRDLPELRAFLAGIPFFASLDEASRMELARGLEPVHVAAGEVVFRQGDAGDGLFLVVSGRLRVTVAAGDTERVLHDLGRGSVVGEIALLTDRPRTATVHAVRDSDLQLLRAPVFQELAERSPALMSGMMRLLADRLLTRDRLLTDRALPPAVRAIAVAAAGQDPRPAAAVGGLLAERLAQTGRVRLVDADAVERELGPGAAQRKPGDPGRGELTGWLHGVERAHDYVIYQAEAADTAWSRLCLSQADVVLLAASADGDPAPGPVEARALATPSLRCELALLHPGQPSGTARWLAGRGVADHHHLRDGQPADAARLARMITGAGCGLVLGGGGPRGFAHLGVIRALEEAGVPVDVVGGTSIGAIVAGLCALGLDDAARVRALTHEIGADHAYAAAGRGVVGPPGGPAARRPAHRRADRGPAAAFLLHLGQPHPGRGGHPRPRAAVARGPCQRVAARDLPAGVCRRRPARRRRNAEQRAGRCHARPGRERLRRRRRPVP